LLTAFAVAVVAPLLLYLWPSGGKTKRSNVTVSLTQPLSQLQSNQTLQFNAPPNYGFMMVDGGGDNAPGKVTFGGIVVRLQDNLTVLSVTCSHLGCSVQFDQTAHIFKCPCHGSEFGINGDVVHGPAQYPLSHLAWKQGSSAQEIIVEGYSLPGAG
jgi:Rieske Fe-S protein